MKNHRSNISSGLRLLRDAEFLHQIGLQAAQLPVGKHQLPSIWQVGWGVWCLYHACWLGAPAISAASGRRNPPKHHVMGLSKAHCLAWNQNFAWKVLPTSILHSSTPVFCHMVRDQKGLLRPKCLSLIASCQAAKPERAALKTYGVQALRREKSLFKTSRYENNLAEASRPK